MAWCTMQGNFGLKCYKSTNAAPILPQASAVVQSFKSTRGNVEGVLRHRGTMKAGMIKGAHCTAHARTNAHMHMQIRAHT